MAFEDRIRLPSLNLIHRRPRLLNLLAHFVEIGQRLITIYAPGGYGKSILLADFAQTTDLPVCWCSLEPADRDPTSFLTLLAYSITDRFHEIDPDSLLKLVQRGDTQASVRRIADVLADVGPHLIIVDDYHKAVSAGMTLALNRLLDQLPATSSMIIAARGDMHLETGQILDLLISERASGLSEEELRFTGDELQRVIRKRFGRQIDLETAEEIAKATHGNIAQILMAGHTQSVQAGRLIGHLSQRLGSDQEVIYGYLASEVFDKQPPELQQFLLHTSILPEMTADLCNQLLNATTAQTTVEELVKRDLFIAQMGAGFRYHDLFAEFLRSKLAADPAAYRQTSLRAAQLLEQQSRFEEAINLYLSVQSWPQAAALLETEGRHFYDTGRALTLHHWLSQMPEAELAQHPRLLLLQGRILNNDLGELKLAMTYLEQAEEQFFKQGDLVGSAEAQIHRSGILRMMGRVKESLDLATTSLDQLIDLKANDQVIAWGIRTRGIAHSTAGNIPEALSDMRQALKLFETLEDAYRVGMCHHDIGVCLEKQGNISGAEHHYRQALRLWEALGNSNDLANTLNSLGVCCYLKGDYGEASKRFGESLNIALQIGATRRAAFAQAGMGDAYLGNQEYHQAIEAYNISTKFAREARVRSLEIYNLVKMGESFYRQHNFIQALNLANQARELAAEIGLGFEQGLAQALQAQIYTQRGEYRAASDHFAAAMTYLAGAEALEQAKVRLWWGYSLLLDLRTRAAEEQLQETIRLALAMGEVRQGLGAVVTETRPLLLHFLHRADTPAATRDNIYLLLQQSREKVELSQPSLQVFAFGPPSLIVWSAPPIYPT
ncbi:MAG: tetratricopeptide repeat protein [Anaerolineae bacterium]